MSTSLLDFSFTREDIISALKELDPYSACPDGNNEVDVIYLDYSKAFDKVDHKVLLE